jgi:hypothetical protein
VTVPIFTPLKGDVRHRAFSPSMRPKRAVIS